LPLFLIVTSQEISLGTFPQWHKFVFYLLDPSTDQRYYPEHNDDIVWEMGSTIDFYPTHQPGEPYPWNPEDWWEINLDVDYSLAKTPPSEILSYLGNPYVASESFEMPITGSLYVIVYSHTNSNDALWMDLPDTQLIQSDLANHTAEVIEIGSFQVGEMIRFFVTSSNSVVSGISLYPRSEYIEEPDNEGNIHLWSLYFEDWTDLMFDDLEVEIYIRPEGGYQGNVAVIITPEQLAPGDTASITFKRRFLNGSLEDFSEEQRFEVGMLEGCDAGQILVGGVLAPYFEEVNQPIYFVAASNLTETDTVKVRVGLIESSASRPVQTNDKDREIITLRKNKTSQQKPFGENTATYCFLEEIDWPKMGDGIVVVENKSVEIMLGETKYFGVKKKTETGELKIEEIKTNYGEEPKFPADADGWVWQKTDVWGEEPLSILKGEKLGVYWEKEKPVWNGSTVKGNIPKGLIRLIGKYWEDTETYRVKLDAKTQDEKTTSLELETKKPKKLHNSKSGLKKEMTKYKDIDGTEKNIDEIIIKNAGKYGIPPQYLKGQMFVEAGKNTNTGTFFPSYRYEPYTTQWDKNLKSWSGKFFFKDKNSADFSDVPNHQNVKYMNYWTTAKTVWEIIEENSQVTSVSNPKHYGKRNSDNTLDFDRDHFPWLQDKYDEILKIEQARKDIKKDEQKVDSANYKMSKWLKEKWKDGKASTEVAQTRCASSYGLLQMMYTTARDQKSYSASEVPEKLNELSLFSHWVEYQSDLLGGFLNSNNWTDGFESTFKTQVVKKWNKATSYPNTYFSNSKLFIPQ